MAVGAVQVATVYEQSMLFIMSTLAVKLSEEFVTRLQLCRLCSVYDVLCVIWWCMCLYRSWLPSR